MIFADKLIILRKKNGWSQEELANRMNVSRQAVSKWEGAQSTPDLGKILQLGEIFGVTTDYLLKDEIEDEEFTDDDTDSFIRRISLEEANEYLEQREMASKRIAIGVVIAIISIIPLLLLGAASELPSSTITENFAGVLGLGIMLVLVGIGVSIFIYTGFKNQAYKFLEEEYFEREYGVEGMVLERKKDYQDRYMKGNIIGTIICILSPISLFMGAMAENDFQRTLLLSGTILLASIGVYFFINVGVKWESMKKLLEESDYSRQNKKSNNLIGGLSTSYWLLATAIYLGFSFYTNNWGMTWIVWPVAGVLYPVIIIVSKLLIKKDGI